MRRWLTFALLGLALTPLFLRSGDVKAAQQPQQVPAQHVELATPADGIVGSETCALCHAEVAKKFGATNLINSSDGHAAHQVMELTEGAGVDVAIEAVGLPATFDICQAIVAAGGRIANVGVHGKPVELHMEKLWDRNISLTTRLVDTVTTPMLLKIVRSGKLQPNKLVTHRFAMDDIMKAYDTFGNAAKEGALKVILTNHAPR